MANIFVSPSTQENNPVTGGGNEEQYMRAICTETCRLLVLAGHKVKMGGSISWQTNVAMANQWMGANGWYIAVHSDAGGGHGTTGYYYTGSVQGKSLCTYVYNRVARASNYPDRGVRANSTFGELRGPKAPACLIETLYHDNLAEATELKASIKEFGLAYAQGILDKVGGTIPAPVTTKWHISSQDDDTIVLRDGPFTGWRMDRQQPKLIVLRRG